MLWFLALATNEDLSEGAGLSAGSTPAGPSFSADSSTVEFVSGAVIALSTALLLRYLKSLHGCVVPDLVQICKGKGSRAPRQFNDGFRVTEIIWSRGCKNCSVLLKRRCMRVHRTLLNALLHDDRSGRLEAPTEQNPVVPDALIGKRSSHRRAAGAG
jgi:hypothetical protein